MKGILRRLVLGGSGVGVLGCTAILDPERIDDLERCDFDDDCSAPDDVRYSNICTVAGEDSDPDFPKFCSPRPSVSCDPDEYDYDSTFRTRAREATGHDELYEDRCEELGPVQGCDPDAEGCASSLSPHEVSGRCDDDDDETPPALSPQPSVAVQDVYDQFCRSVYCDVRFVCDTRTLVCTPCELGRPIGRGGCGDLYPGGERSPVYLDDDAMQAACAGPHGDPQDAAIGEFAE